MEVSLVAEKIGQIGSLPVTNSMLVTWIITILLSILAFFATRNMQKVPTGLQNFFEMVIEAVYGIVEDLAHSRAKVFFPYLMTFFLFIIAGNWLGLLPGFGTIGFNEIEDGKEVFIPLFRSVNSDLNTTLSLALISLVLTHYYSLRYLGLWGYIKHWFSLNPVILFVGILEIVSEFTKLISLSLRLFGNIFAGEVVLSTISNLFAFIVPLPFYFLEIVVGFVQAAVFMMLTLVFMVLLSEKHAEEHK